MRKRTLVATIIALSVMGLCACESNALLPEKQTETDETKIENPGDSENNSFSIEEDQNEENENNEEKASDITTVEGKVYSKIVVTGIEDWQSVASSIYGLEDAFNMNYMDPNGDMISGLYAPGTPDRLEFVFDTQTGKAVSATYYGQYNSPEDAEQGKEALEENLSGFEGDIKSVSLNEDVIEVSFDPASMRFNATIRTYFLEGRHDTEGYTDSCESTYNNAGSIYTTFKGDNYACDVIQGIKVTWYE